MVARAVDRSGGADLFAMVPRHEGDRIAAEVVRRIVAVPKRDRVCDWAATNRFIAGAGADATRYDPSETPYICVPGDLATDDRVDLVLIPWATQLGKTELMITIELWWMDVLCQVVGHIMPTIDRVRDEMRRKVIPAVKRCPSLAEQITGREEDMNASGIMFATGAAVSAYSSGALSHMRGKSIGRWVIDEMDAPGFEMECLGEARQRQKAISPSECSMVIGSSPGDEGTGTDLVASECASVFRFHVPCPHCGTYQELVFDRGEYGLKWKKAESVIDRVDTARDTAHYVCQSRACRASKSRGRIENYHKRWMLRMGLWVQDGERIESDGRVLETKGLSDAGQWERSLARRTYDEMRGEGDALCGVARDLGVRIVEGPGLSSRCVFYLSSLYSPFPGATFGQMAAAFAASGRLTKKFTTDWLGEPWRSPGKRIDPGKLVEAMPRLGDRDYYEFGTVPPWALALTLSADIQRDRAVVTVRGWGELGERSCLVWAGEIETDGDRPLPELDCVIDWAFPVWGKPKADPLRVSVFCADSGDGARTDHIYAWVLRHKARLGRGRYIWSVKGSNVRNADWIAKPKDMTDVVRKGQKMVLPDAVPHIEVNTSRCKHSLFASMGLSVGDDGREAVDLGGESGQVYLWPGPWSADETDGSLAGQPRRAGCEIYFNQVTGEEYALVESRTNAAPRREWRPIPGRENHYMDSEVYHKALAAVHNISGLRRRKRAAASASNQSRPRAAGVPMDASVALRGG